MESLGAEKPMELDDIVDMSLEDLRLHCETLGEAVTGFKTQLQKVAITARSPKKGSAHWKLVAQAKKEVEEMEKLRLKEDREFELQKLKIAADADEKKAMALAEEKKRLAVFEEKKLVAELELKRLVAQFEKEKLAIQFETEKLANRVEERRLEAQLRTDERNRKSEEGQRNLEEKKLGRAQQVVMIHLILGQLFNLCLISTMMILQII
jgi:hypothetical protein